MKRKIFKRLGMVFIGLAIILTSFNLYHDQKAKKESARLIGEFKKGSEALADEERDLTIPVKNIDGTDFIGYIEIPALGKNLPVTSDRSYELMQSYPNRYKGKTYDDPLIIMAHNFQSHFGDLPKLKENDEIIFTDVLGRQIRYQVLAMEVIDGDDVEDMVQTDFDLSLFTCNILDRSTRYTIRANKIYE